MDHGVASTVRSHVHTACGLGLKDWSRSWGLAQGTPGPITNGIDDGGEIRRLSYGIVIRGDEDRQEVECLG